MLTPHTFSIENNINPLTQKPFGNKYAGKFTIRRPSIGDKIAIAAKNSAFLNAYGQVNASLIGEGLKLMAYCFAFVSTVTTIELPEWFNMDNLFDDHDEAAVLAVWGEVGGFLDTFRPAANPPAGGAGGEQS